ncbi:MAG: hypothetical protein OXI86_07705, partial [Candidatus Poribacteria bacterium]|nr:hypothetical protein [Candidatus Poribacteria bacterium]
MVENLLDIAMFILFLSLLVALPWHLIPETANDGIRSISPCAPMSHKVSFVFFLLIWIAVVLYHIVSVINGGWESSAKLWPMLGIT